MINEDEMKEAQEVRITRQRMHVSIFRLDRWFEIIETKSRCGTVKGRGAQLHYQKKKTVGKVID